MEEKILNHLIASRMKEGEAFSSQKSNPKMVTTNNIVTTLRVDYSEAIDALHRLHHEKKIERQWAGIEYHWRASGQ